MVYIIPDVALFHATQTGVGYWLTTYGIFISPKQQVRDSVKVLHHLYHQRFSPMAGDGYSSTFLRRHQPSRYHSYEGC